MIYLLFGILTLAAFAAGMFIYRQGVKDGMSRLHGNIELAPMFDTKEKPQPSPFEVDMQAINSYTGGTIQKKR